MGNRPRITPQGLKTRYREIVAEFNTKYSNPSFLHFRLLFLVLKLTKGLTTEELEKWRKHR